ncbi:MAG: murein biosynthesis integral membrane protein MurJ [Verrucomicrobiae bacterium]|nr:murein biosynthesis integral membrane protein MurJ [Verrucomicrobiae bacterium]
MVGLAIVGSRIFGLVREQVLAAMFGAGKLLDAFYGAFRIPNLLRDLLAEGALSTAFTTVFTQVHEKEGSERAWRLVRLMFSLMIVFMGAITLLGILAAPLIISLTNAGFHAVEGKWELTVALTRILFPFIFFVSIAAVVMGILNARHVFALPASASTVFNIVSVITGVTLAYLFDPQENWLKPHFTEKALYGISLGVLIGGIAQLLIQLPSLWKQGFRAGWIWDLKDRHLREVLRLMLPSVISGSAVQVNVLVNGVFASMINGGISWLNCAFRLMQFPIGVFGVAIATVTLPAVSILKARGDMQGFSHALIHAIRLTLFLTLPAATGLAVLAYPIIQVIYEHGRFLSNDTLATSQALQAYALGLVGYSLIKVLTPCFYALGEAKAPLRVSLWGMGINLILNSVFFYALGWGHIGLAFSTSMLALINSAQLLVMISRRVHLFSSWGRFLCSLFFSTLMMALTAWVAIGLWPGSDSLFEQALRLLSVILLATVVFFFCAFLTRMQEAKEFFSFLKRPKIASKS